MLADVLLSQPVTAGTVSKLETLPGFTHFSPLGKLNFVRESIFCGAEIKQVGECFPIVWCSYILKYTVY